MNNKIVKSSLLALTLAFGANAVQMAQASPEMGGSMAMTAKMDRGLMGSFKQVTHATSGKAMIDGNMLKLSNFETGMGPALHVYLVQGDASSNAAVKKAVDAKKFSDLGMLKSSKGDQSYTLPKGAMTKGSSVVIWCNKFHVVFGSAMLS